MSINKIIHIYRKYERLPEIADKYNVNINDIIYDNNLDVVRLQDFYPIVINLPHNCSEKEQLSCIYEKRGCRGVLLWQVGYIKTIT